MKSFLVVAVAVMLASAPVAWGGERRPAKPSATDKCRVCGMIVHKYPDFLAQIVFKDGSVVFFDGAKDLYKYYFRLQRSDAKGKVTQIDSVYVTDYYSLRPVDGLKAYYVAGSDVYGPMGKELIAFGKQAEARGFAKDHKGRSPLTFRDINEAVINGLE